MLARARWSSREVAGRLLHLPLDAFVAPGAEAVTGLEGLPEVAAVPDGPAAVWSRVGDPHRSRRLKRRKSR